MEQKTKSNRNYQLDCLKLLFSIFVFVAHLVYVTPNTIADKPLFPMMGFICVYFFFIVSGMLMVQSKKSICVYEPEKAAFDLVNNRIGGILKQYWVAL